MYKIYSWDALYPIVGVVSINNVEIRMSSPRFFNDFFSVGVVLLSNLKSFGDNLSYRSGDAVFFVLITFIKKDLDSSAHSNCITTAPWMDHCVGDSIEVSLA